MANRLSDEELRQSLLAFGEHVGPITPGTRSVYERRLVFLKKSKGAALNALSSDDSEVENTPSPRRKRTYKPEPENRPGDVFKKPVAVSVPVPRLYNRTQSNKKYKKTSKNASFDAETSDSDFDTDLSSPGKSSSRSRRKVSSDLNTLRKKDVPDSEKYPFLRKSHITVWHSEPENSSVLFSPVLERLKKETEEHSYQPQSNGYLPNANGGESFAEKGSSTNHSHCVSWLLVLGAIAFFVVIGALYISEVQKNNQQANKHNSMLCEDVKEDECLSFIIICRELHNLLAKVAGDFECGSRKHRNMSVSEAKAAILRVISVDSSMQKKQFNFDRLFNKSLDYFKKNPKLEIICTENALESSVAVKALWCRIRYSIQWTAARILIIVGMGLLGTLCWLGVLLWRKRKEAREALFYEMVEKVIDLLQEAPDGSDNCRAVVNIRDALIPAKERRQKQRLWDCVVAFVEESESRVSVEYRTINGEDFKMWRWHSLPSESESGKPGKVWQGQAFGSVNKGKSAVYSPCLKIRNMFDPEAEYGDSWQTNVQDAILEKCEGNDGIRHVAMETTNSEGCVFMLCDSTESAGKVFNELHGWWFDGKLVTVKYIPQKRYLERFPSATSCHTPLRPSNNKRLSLSAPFFSSALERS